VEAVFEADRSMIEACIEWNKTSQPYARVESVEVSWSEPGGGIPRPSHPALGGTGQLGVHKRHNAIS